MHYEKNLTSNTWQTQLGWISYLPADISEIAKATATNIRIFIPAGDLQSSYNFHLIAQSINSINDFKTMQQRVIVELQDDI